MTFNSSCELFGACMASFAVVTCNFKLFPKKEAVRKLSPSSSLKLIHKVVSFLVCSQAAELLGVEGIADADSQGLSKRCKQSVFRLLVILACCSWNLMHLNSLTAGIMLNYHRLALENFWVT